MSNLPISSKYRSRPNDPVPDAERNDLSARLNDAFTKGSIGQDQYDQMLDRVFDAKNLGELAPVVELLGKPSTHDTPALVQQAPQGRPGELAEGVKPSLPATTMVVAGVVGLGVVAILLLLMLALF
ncbi:hypothetical protein GCM10027418_23990 [Mariniluteicoccus endophyticus]